MTPDLPAWIPAEPGTFPALPEAEGRVGRVVVLLSTEGALSAGWAGAVAVDLAASWSEGGQRVVVADAGLATPLLDEALGIPNHEGLVDALRWGVSVQRVIRRIEGRRFLALTAGTAVADTAAVLALPRWHALCAGFREAGVTLAVLVPSWEESLAGVLGEADGVVVLAEPDEDLGDLVSGVDVPILAVTGRDGPAVEQHRVVPPDFVAEMEDTATDVAATGALDGDMPAPQAATEAPAEGAGPEEEADTFAELSTWGGLDEEGTTSFEEQDVEGVLEPEDHFPEDVTLDVEPATPRAHPFETEDPTVPSAVTVPHEVEDDFVLPDPIPVPPSLEEIVEESEAPAGRGRARTLLLVLFLVVVAVGLAAWYGYVEIPGLTLGRETSFSALPPVVESPAPPTETSTLQGFSLALGAYQDSVIADERVATLTAQVPGVIFHSVPVEVDGTLFHRVLAGPGTDSVAVAALASLIADATALDPSSWVARWTPKAFQLGEMPDREAAERRVEGLGGLGVPAYVLAVDYSDGSVRYRVFAGAFSDAAEASYLSGLLDERGLSSATLSDRIGRLPE